MDHPRLILHVGGAKCGSSAFQAALSAQPAVAAAGGPKVVYAALHAKRGLVHGDELRKLARKSKFGYISSTTAGELLNMPLADRNRMLADLQALMDAHDLVILSNEAWLGRHNALHKGGFLEGLGQPFGVFAAVRPQIEFLNSAWWQWGAWTGQAFETWIQNRVSGALWNTSLRQWRRNPACTGVTVRLLSRDIVGDFLNAYGLQPHDTLPRGKASNVSLPGEVLRLFQRHPELRAGPGRAVMDFILSGFRLGDQPTPWVMPADLGQQIIEQSHKDNQRLGGLLPPEQADRMRATPGWWSVEAYADRVLQSALPLPVDREGALEMQTRLLQAQGDTGARPLPADAPAADIDAMNAGRVAALYKAARMAPGPGRSGNA